MKTSACRDRTIKNQPNKMETTAHSTSDSATFSSNKISKHKTLSRASTAHSFCIQDRLCLPCSIAHTPCTSTCTMHLAIPSQLPSTTLLCTQLTNTKHSWQNGARCQKWHKCVVVVPILFGWFLRVPSFHALVFIWKTFL